MADPLLSFDADQQNSAVLKNRPQNDRWRAEQISPHRAPPFTLVVIADGEGENAAGDVANLAVEIAFAEATLRRDDPLPRLLKHLLSQMNEVISQRGAGDLVGITMAAIQSDAVWLIQAGAQTRCYRVRTKKSVDPLTTDNDHLLGKRPSLPGIPTESHKLKRGDKLVFCTDGLFAGDLVTAADLGKIDRYQDVKGAARHLSAFAMGRNVSDNVTVVVAAYGRKRGWPLRVLAFDLLGVILAILIVTVVGTIIANYARILPRPPDLGIAVLAGGRAVQVEQLQIIYPGSDINASPESSVRLSLKRRESLQSGLTESIPSVSLFLGKGTFANLTSLDVQGFMDAQNGIIQPTDLTELRLNSGSILLLSQSARTFYVWPGETTGQAAPLIILKSDEAALGVTREGSRITAYCMRGTCSIHSGKNSAPLPAASKIFFSSVDPSVEGLVASSMDQTDWETWLELCTSLQADPRAISGACQMLVP
jgi:serine/threonine protein phosphatase PrpC